MPRLNEITRRSHHRAEPRVTDFVSIGGWFFAADPERSFLEQTIFWAPEAVPTIVPVRPSLLAGSHTHVRLDLNELNESQFRQGPDGWHAVLYLRGVEHRIWLKETPIIAAAYTVRGTHEVRDQIKRLVKTGLALVQGGYRALLRPPSRKR